MPGDQGFTHLLGRYPTQYLVRWRAQDTKDKVELFVLSARYLLVARCIAHLVHIAIWRLVSLMLEQYLSHTHSLPLKIGFPVISSARIQPIDHTSTVTRIAVRSDEELEPALTGCGIPPIGQHDLWRSVPSRRNI